MKKEKKMMLKPYSVIKNIHIYKNINYLIKQIILLNHLALFIIIFSFTKSNSEGIDESTYSYITLKVTNGTNKIYNDQSGFTKPNEVRINGKQEENKAFHTFKEPINIVILVWKETVTNCNNMFRDCQHITEIDFSHFNTSQVTYFGQMFRNCYLLTSLNLSNFDTSRNTGTMVDMFWNCISLEYLDASSFNTSKVTSFGHMFCNCKSLLSLDISNLDFSKGQKFDNMFNGCEKLTSINLNNFDTSSAYDLSFMFNDCKSLKYLNLSNFNTSLVTNMNSIFRNCKSLLSLNIQNWINLKKLNFHSH